MPAHPRASLIVALDGPASSGKSSVGMRAAARLGYRFFDTGILYRAVAWLAVRDRVSLDDAPALSGIAAGLSVGDPDPAGSLHIRFGGRQVDEEVRGALVDREASVVARVFEVRDALIAVQRDAAREGGIIVAGRDIGTVVLPDADLKLYLDASVEERARRRCVERSVAPGSPEGEAILADLARRDSVDRSREAAPLRVPRDAIVIITDRLTLAGAVNEVVATVRSVEAAAAGWPSPSTGSDGPRRELA